MSTKLRAAVAAVATCIERHAHPDSRKVQLRAGDGRLRVSTPDGDTKLEIALPFDRGSFAVAVGPNELRAAVRACGESPEFAASKDRLFVHGGGYRFTLPVDAIEPEASVTEAVSVTVSSTALRRALRSTLVSVAPEGNKYGLTGLHVELGGGQLAIVATDGNRLSRVAIEATGEGAFPRGRLLRQKPGHLLLGLLVGPDRPVTLSLAPDDLVVCVPADGVTLRTQLLDALFPDYRQVVPSRWHRSMLLDRNALLASVRRLRPMCPPSGLTIRAVFEEEMVTLSAKTPWSGEAWTQLPCVWPDGFVDPVVRGVGAEFAAQLVGRCPPGPVRWDVVVQPLGPMRISSPAGSDDDYAILMPVRLD